METKANYVLVGVFTLVVLVLTFGFVYWSANVSSANNQVPLIVRIEGSVTGLSQGSQVLFNGLKVGDVRSLRIDPNDPRVVIARTMVDSSIPVTTSTQATVGFQGLTGIAFIELKGGDLSERNIIKSAEEQGAVPVIRANPSDVTDILATAKDIAERANNILGQFESLVSDVGPAVHTTATNVAETSKNIQTFTARLAANSSGIDTLLQNLSALATSAGKVADALPDAVNSARDVIKAIDPQAVHRTVDNVAAISDTLKAQSQNIAGIVETASTAVKGFAGVSEAFSRNSASVDRLLANVGPLSDKATSVAANLDTTLDSARKIVAAIDPNQITTAVNNVASAASNASELAAAIGAQKEEIRTAVVGASNAMSNIDRITTTVAKHSDQIDRFVAGLGPVSQNATQALRRFDSTVAAAQTLIAAIDPARISSTVESIQTLASTIGAQKDQISSVIASASGASRNIEEITQTLAQNREKLDNFISRLAPLGDNVIDASNKLNNTLDQASRLVASIDQQKISSTVSDVSSIVAALNAKRTEIQSIVDNVDTTVKTLDTTLSGFNGTRMRVDEILAGVSPEKVNTAVDNISAASTNVAKAADSVANIAGDIGGHREDINSIITNVQQTSAKLNSASDQLTKLLDQVNGMLSSGDGKGLGTDVRSTLAAIRETALAIKSRIGPISDNLQSFSGKGLQEILGMAREITNSVSRIQDAVTNFSNNPSRLLYGGQEVKQFNGRSRR